MVGLLLATITPVILEDFSISFSNILNPLHKSNTRGYGIPLVDASRWNNHGAGLVIDLSGGGDRGHKCHNFGDP